ncbi:hypothetical protein L7F22_040031 [Adiantum nelumboides]|nr:hypothetical protein [Adiantum nelumboides]
MVAHHGSSAVKATVAPPFLHTGQAVRPPTSCCVSSYARTAAKVAATAVAVRQQLLLAPLTGQGTGWLSSLACGLAGQGCHLPVFYSRARRCSPLPLFGPLYAPRPQSRTPPSFFSSLAGRAVCVQAAVAFAAPRLRCNGVQVLSPPSGCGQSCCVAALRSRVGLGRSARPPPFLLHRP